MSYPDIGTENPVHQLETTSNVTAESLEIYSDYTFFSSSDYDWARQLRLRVNTPSLSNVFVDMGLEKDDGTYFYISKPLSTATDPKNNFRIYENGKVLINRTDATRSERLQVDGDVRVTGNLNVTGTTIVPGNVGITGDLYVTSFNQEKNYIVPVGMIVMWDGAVDDIPTGWELVTDVSGYYLKSDPNQTSVQTSNISSFDIRGMPDHGHNTLALTAPNNQNHSHGKNSTNTSSLGNHSHTGTNANNMGNSAHSHSFTELGKWSNNIKDNGVPNVSVVVSDVNRSTVNIRYIGLVPLYATEDNHSHGMGWVGNTTTEAGGHTHPFSTGIDNTSATHTHTPLSSSGVSTITVNLTPAYREIRLIKKLPYL